MESVNNRICPRANIHLPRFTGYITAPKDMGLYTQHIQYIILYFHKLFQYLVINMSSQNTRHRIFGGDSLGFVCLGNWPLVHYNTGAHNLVFFFKSTDCWTSISTISLIGPFTPVASSLHNVQDRACQSSTISVWPVDTGHTDPPHTTVFPYGPVLRQILVKGSTLYKAGVGN